MVNYGFKYHRAVVSADRVVEPRPASPRSEVFPQSHQLQLCAPKLKGGYTPVLEAVLPRWNIIKCLNNASRLAQCRDGYEAITAPTFSVASSAPTLPFSLYSSTVFSPHLQYHLLTVLQSFLRTCPRLVGLKKFR